jgi:hypothetical protein
MFGCDGAAGPAENGGGEASASEVRQQQTSAPFSGWRQPTLRSVHIINMQDSNAATTTGVGGRQEPGQIG